MTAAVNEHMAYAGYCINCGRMCAVVVDVPSHEKSTRQSVAEFMRDGMTINRVTCDEVRSSKFGCTDDCDCRHCEKKRRKKLKQEAKGLGLFGESSTPPDAEPG